MDKLIGYQIISNDGENEIPELFSPSEVIEDIYIAKRWLELERECPENGCFRWVLLPIFEGDIEEPIILKLNS